MNRRSFSLAALASVLAVAAPALAAASRRWKFRIKTKSGGIQGLTISADNYEAAKVKLYKQYPDCQILDAEEVP